MVSENRSGATPPSFQDHWLTETLRLRESQWGPLDDAAEVRRLRSEAGRFEDRVFARARLLARREGLATALERWRAVARLTAVLFAVAAFLIGCGAAAGALGPGGAVNLAPALTALLGLNTLAFLLWMASFAVQGGATGSVLADGWLKLTRKLARGPDVALLPRALLELLSRQRMHRWAAGALSHGLWSLALIGVLLTLLGLLATRRYTFHWETTLLSPDTFVLAVQGLGWLPSLLGFPAPSAEIIRSSGGGLALPEAAHADWSVWLIGVVLVHGLLPRLAALALSVLVLRRRRRQLALDTSLPGIAELRERLTPASESTGIDRPAPPPMTSSFSPSHADAGAMRQRALLGLELPAELVWENRSLPASVSDLGIIDSREQRHRLLEALQPQPAQRLLVCCDARQTPDRGTVSFLTQLGDVALDMRLLLLPEGAPASRRELWHQQLKQAGFEVGRFCRTWEDALDWLAQADSGGNGR
ncbi:MAG TPA: DUF2868 domain-containing protein [Burkholderiaceae bacterium]|nr:DUF2868 domain-containing protein [Burkholderiaceae bacterium]